MTNARRKNNDRMNKREKETQNVHSKPFSSLILSKSLDYPNLGGIKPNGHWNSAYSNWYYRKPTAATSNKVNPKTSGKIGLTRKKQLHGDHKDSLFAQNSHLGTTSNELSPWSEQDSTKLKLHSEFSNWNAKSKPKSLEFSTPTHSYSQGTFNNTLAIRGNQWKFSERLEPQNGYDNCRRNVSLEDITKVCETFPELPWADAFTKPTIRRLNEVVLSLSLLDKTGKYRSRKAKCSCLYHE